MMMLLPDPGVLNTMIRDRHHRLRPNRAARPAAGFGLRVRLGRALIAAGSTLSGERVEMPARRTTLPYGA
jgi:hypothetical protein